MPSAPDFLVAPGFVSPALCRVMAAFYAENRHLCQKAHEPFWADRIMGLDEIEPCAPHIAQWMVEALKTATREIELFYAVPKPLYADVINIVGWPQGSSMPLHADNAYASGEPHALAHRQYSGVIYLNDDYDGGELFIQRPDGNSFINLKPAAGTLVSLPAGLSHQHGVAPVIRGLRTALTFFLTDDEARQAHQLKQRELS